MGRQSYLSPGPAINVGSQEPNSSHRRLKILHVVGSLNRGGIETWLSQVLALLAGDEFRCDVCTYRSENGAYASELVRLGCTVHHIPLGSTLFGIRLFSRQFRSLLRRERYDVVHSHGFALLGFLSLLAQMEHIPARIAHAHSAGWWWGDGLPRRLALRVTAALARRSCTHGIGCSAEAAAALFGLDWPNSPRYGILHCGIDLEPFRGDSTEAQVRRELGLDPSSRIIGHVGSFTAIKNHDFLFAVADQVFRSCEDAYLLLVGDGPLRPKLTSEVNRRGLSNRVIFTGTSSRVPRLLKAMNVFVMPSLHEGLPIALLEAQAAGLPCVVSDCVPSEANVSGSEVRFLALDLGPAKWAHAVLRVLDKPRAALTLGPGRLEGTDFDIRSSASRLAAFYRSVAIRLPQESI